ncbi:hypothetical protein QBC43DRAFT_288255 [Cladorrhinum sp. PSN259]|nr:hypothetical protein QBC43DRAFT_288255 [Cladorrhinum sp. PSN259]
MSDINTAEDVGASTRWGDEAHQAMVVAIAKVLDKTDTSVAKNKDEILATMEKFGFSFTWEAFR